ncbi:hypothetical protein Hanom_Chr05g00410171 [Helianthus anomalus]
MDLDNIAYRTRSNFPSKNDCVDIDVTKPSENLSVKSGRKACRSTTSTADVRPKRKVKRCELSNMKTRAEKSGDGYMYGFTKWSSFLKSNHIQFGATLFFKYVKSSQL